MPTAQKPLFLLDLDDTLLDTSRLKQDLFLNIAESIGSQSPEPQRGDDIKRLYSTFCKKSQGIVSYQGFADFLVRIFANQEQEIRSCFKIDYKQYLLPESRDFITHLKKQGTVIIWTAGTFEDQAKKLLDTGLISQEQAQQIISFTKLESTQNKSENLPLAIVDTGKVLGINERLNWFLNNFSETQITLIDNEAKNIAAVSETKDQRLRAFWFDHGDQKNPQLADKLRQELPNEIKRFQKLSEITSFLKTEGIRMGPEQKG